MASRNSQLFIDTKKNQVVTKATWTKADGSVASDIKKKDVDRVDLVLYKACFESDRINTIWVKSLAKDKKTKEAEYRALKSAINKGIDVRLFLDGAYIKVTAQDIDNLGQFWSMFFADKNLSDATLKLLKDTHLAVAFMKHGTTYVTEGLQNYIRNSGYDVGFTSEVAVSKKAICSWDAKDYINGNAWVDDRGLTHYTSTKERYKYIATTSLNDLLKAYVQVRYYESHGFVPERDKEQAKRDEFCLEMYGMTEAEYQEACYKVKGYCTLTNEDSDENPDWLSEEDIDDLTSDDFLDNTTDTEEGDEDEE